ncbi:proteasome maturation factor UMP1 [Crepidotus variabilis]|uniref:Proteasome maturation factor UMP1 n=1 Tax=Crepidotus variabilis TaxID=179855 RepID=A0A9P6EVL4_9AGAR|nr:proteasome maturation factor UMP1 [Crepidotus variabilis]
MEPSYRIVPSSSPKSASIKDTANSLGLHDSLQYGPRSLAAETKSGNGLKERLENWEATQDNLKLTLERNTFGMHVPLRKLMERKIVSDRPHTLCAPQTNLHLDILMGRDESIDFPDVFLGREAGPSFDIHNEIQKNARS